MVEELIHGNTEFVEITSNYEYVLGQLEGALLNFKLDFEGKQWEREGVLDAIAMKLKSRAKEYAEAQRIYDTGQLIGEIDSYVDGGRVHLVSRAQKHYIVKEGRRIPHYNPKSTARSFTGGYYGGHVEFGHKTPGGGFYPARPYLRPALRTVSEESKGEMIGTIQSMFSGALAGFDQRGFTLNGRSFMYTGLAFGRNFSHRASATHEHGLSKLGGYHRLNTTTKEQKAFSKAFSARRGGKDSTTSRISHAMRWDGSRVRKGGWMITASREKSNPNKGQRELNTIKSGRDPSYKQTSSIRSLGSPAANRFYHNQQYQNRQSQEKTRWYRNFLNDRK